MVTKVFAAGEHLVTETIACDLLTIEEGAVLKAPKGKTLVLSVGGVGVKLEPGSYGKDAVLKVVNFTNVKTEGIFGNPNGMNFRGVLCIEDGKIVEDQSVLEMIKGSYDEKSAKGLSIVSTEDYLNGVIIRGKSEYTIDDAYIELEGEGGNDFSGLGSPIMVLDDSKLTVNNSRLVTHGLTRTVTHSAGNSVINYNNCELEATSAPSDFFFPVWCLGLKGTNRGTQIAGYGQVYFNNCKITSNGWGALCIDGAERGIMEARNSTISLIGPRARGYAAFPERHSSIRLFDSKVRSNGYGFLMDTMGDGGGGYYSNTDVEAGAFGVYIFKDRGGEFKADNGTVIKSERASFCISASNTFVNLDNVSLKPENGILVQLEDCDVGPMDAKGIRLPIGEVDTYIEGRDLSSADEKKDTFINWKNMDVEGDLFNSSTNLDFVFRPYDGPGPDFNMYVIDPFSDRPAGGPGGPGHGGPPEPPALGDNDANPDMEFLHDESVFYGPRNMSVKFENVKLKGSVSCASQAYREGLEIITRDNLTELGNITQTPSPAINNGVILSLDKDCEWTLTGTCYLTALSIEKGAVIKAADGKSIKASCDGQAIDLASGEYKGKIVIEVA